MAPTPKASHLIDFMLLQAEKERRLAQECRDLARRIHFRPDRIANHLDQIGHTST